MKLHSKIASVTALTLAALLAVGGIAAAIGTAIADTHRWAGVAVAFVAFTMIGLGEPLPGAEHYLRAEVLYAVTHEGARHLDDVLARIRETDTQASLDRDERLRNLRGAFALRQPRPWQAKTSLQGRRILLVDDEPSIQRAVAPLLRSRALRG